MMLLSRKKKVEEGFGWRTRWRRAGRRGEERRGARDQKMEDSGRNNERGTTDGARTMESARMEVEEESEWLGWRVHRPSSLHISNAWPWSSMCY